MTLGMQAAFLVLKTKQDQERNLEKKKKGGGETEKALHLSPVPVGPPPQAGSKVTQIQRHTVKRESLSAEKGYALPV